MKRTAPVRRAVIFARILVFAVLAFFAAAFFAVAQPEADGPLARAEALSNTVAARLFEAIDLADKRRFHVTVSHAAAPRAVLIREKQGELTAGLIDLVETPEELAAAVAHMIAALQVEGPRGLGAQRFRVETRAPGRSDHGGWVTGVGESIIGRSEAAALSTLRRDGAYGLSQEETLRRALQVDARTVEILDRAGLTAAALRSLYAKLRRRAGGNLERQDFEGRQLVAEQIAWLDKRLDGAAPARDAQRWRDLDADLEAVKAALAS